MVWDAFLLTFHTPHNTNITSHHLTFYVICVVISHIIGSNQTIIRIICLYYKVIFF